jgi:zinc transporter ZupT
MIYILQIVAVAIGLGLVAVFNIKSQRNTKMLLAFSGAYLFSIVILHFLPELFEHRGHEIGLYILAGFLLQILLDFYSTGLEHGHYHKEHFAESVLPLSAIVGLFVHEFFEGIPIAMQEDEQSTNVLLLAIVLHKVPVTIVLYSLLISLHLSKKMLWLAMILFAIFSPLGTLLGDFVRPLTTYAHEFTAFATGIFLHVSTTILFEGSHNHKYNFAKILVVVAGMVLAYLSLLGFSH